MEMENGSHISLPDLLLVVGGAEERQGHPVRAQGRLDHVGDVSLLRLVVKVGQILSGYGLVLSQVVVRAVCDAPQLAPAEGEQELNVGGGLAVEAQLLLLMVTHPQLFFFQSQILQPADAELLPVVKPLQVRIRLAEELQLHLLELSGTEGKVSGSDLVAERFSDLADAEGNFLSGGSLNILEVDKNALSRLRS